MTGTLAWHAWAALGLCTVAVLCAALAVLAPRPVRLPVQRRRPGATGSVSTLAEVTAAVTSFILKVLQRGSRGHRLAAALEGAGVTMQLQDVVLLGVVGVLVASALGALLGGPLVALVFACMIPALGKVWLGMLTRRRQRAFADQLDDSLQLMANSLRAGHSLQQGLAAVAGEAEEPTATEFSRIINETRVGRDLGQALEDAARRMESQDFVWVTQAIAINREIGGNLAEVLNGVSVTIRERNAIRGQVKALAAEGKLSALVLMALPFGVSGFLMISNPAYLLKFTQSLIGYGLLGVAAVMLVVGGLWLRKTVQVTF